MNNKYSNEIKEIDLNIKIFEDFDKILKSKI